jgi:hypothetical protein
MFGLPRVTGVHKAAGSRSHLDTSKNPSGRHKKNRSNYLSEYRAVFLELFTCHMVSVDAAPSCLTSSLWCWGTRAAMGLILLLAVRLALRQLAAADRAKRGIGGSWGRKGSLREEWLAAGSFEPFPAELTQPTY